MHVIISTHTTRHLRSTLVGVAFQSRRPDRIIVSCDNDSAEIQEVVRNVSAECSMDVTLVQRSFTGNARSGQVRNNAVRALLGGASPPMEQTRLVLLDGDCCPAPDAFALHERLGGEPQRLVIGFRVDLSEEQTANFSEDALRHGRLPVTPTPRQMDLLKSRQRRYQRQRLMRRFGLEKHHKPKLLSANFSISLGAYRRLNGFDESYERYGQEDDDFGRRSSREFGLPVVAVSKILVFHLYHPTRAPGNWHDSPNSRRFAAGEHAPTRCERGLEFPLAQDDLRVEEFVRGSVHRAWTIAQRQKPSGFAPTHVGASHHDS